MKTEEQKPENKQCECGSDLVNTTNKDNPFCFHCGKSLTQQETLEEAAEKYANEWEEIHPTLDPEDMTPIEVSKIDFIAGAKWQAENMPMHILDVENTYVHIEDNVIVVEKNDKTKRMFSEEEVFNLCRGFAIFVSQEGASYEKQLQWFEQKKNNLLTFKKK